MIQFTTQLGIYGRKSDPSPFSPFATFTTSRRANMLHVRQPRPDAGRGVQAQCGAIEHLRADSEDKERRAVFPETAVMIQFTTH